MNSEHSLKITSLCAIFIFQDYLRGKPFKYFAITVLSLLVIFLTSVLPAQPFVTFRH